MPSFAQHAVLAAIPKQAAYLFFTLNNPQQLASSIKALGEFCISHNALLGVGQRLIINPALQAALQHQPCKNHHIPQQAADLLIWLRADDAGEIFWQTSQILQLAGNTFSLQQKTDAFCYREGRDLTGYEDGTENPTDAAAEDAAIIKGGELDKSSFFVVQRWQHQLTQFKQQPQHEQDNIIGRRLEDNEELEDAPESAHVKRTAQESFTPEIFMLRKSMPWVEGNNAGLMFTAFVTSIDKFERMLRRMTGDEDGIKDGLFSFSEIHFSSYFWCPAQRNHQLDFSPCGFIQ